MKIVFFSKNKKVLEILDRKYHVITVYSNDEIVSLKENFQIAIVDTMCGSNTINIIKKYFPTKNIILLGQLNEVDKNGIDDFIIYPSSEEYILQRIKLWTKDKKQNFIFEKDYFLIEKIQSHINKALNLSNNNSMSFHLKAIEWISKFIEIKYLNTINFNYYFNYIISFLKIFGCRCEIDDENTLLYALSVNEQKNILEIIFIYTRCFSAEEKLCLTITQVKNIINLIIDKPLLNTQHFALNFLKEIINEKKLIIEKFPSFTLLKYTLIDERNE